MEIVNGDTAPATGVRRQELLTEPHGDAGAMSFTHVPCAFQGALAGDAMKEGLLKWGLDQTLILEKFRFAGALQSDADAHSALIDFFNSADVQAALAASCAGPRAGLARPNGSYNSVTFEPLSTSAVDLGLFKRLRAGDHPIVAPSGYIRKCMDEIYDGATSSNLVTDMLLNEESENAFVFEEAEKRELLFQLFKWATVGGALCQPEENVDPYLAVVKALYKALVHVVRSPVSGAIEVVSRAFLVRELDGSHGGLFPEENSNSMCVLVFTPSLRTVTYLNSAFVPFLR